MDIGLLLLRLVVGLTLAAHGSQKLFAWFGGYGLAGTGGFMESLGFKPGRAYAALAGLCEFVGGALLALGLLTPLGAAFVVIVMLVATFTVHWSKGFFNTEGGFELPLVLATGALVLAFAGPGAYSFDAVLGIETFGVRPGIVSLLVAALAASGALATREIAKKEEVRP